MRFRALGLAALLLAGCREAAPVAPKPAATAKPASANVIDFGNGTSVLSRTGEFSLQFSPLMMIDFDWESLWSSPVGNPEQTIVFALSAPARVHEIALRGTQLEFAAPHSVILDSSLDNQTWTPLVTVKPKANADVQTFAFPPKGVRYIRLKTTS
ncbi:MAG TPA: discoidin domain-containing protein, partial [Thermoanaerobaculia bacterium]